MAATEQLRGSEHHRKGVARYATFRVDGLYCGIEVLRVQEMLRPQQMTPVPLASPLIRGLINLRGQIVTAVDMRRRLGLAERPSQAPPPMNMVVKGEGRVVSLLVDHIGDVVDVPGDAFETPPGNLRTDQRRLISGVYKLEVELLVVLDVDRVLQIDDADHTRRTVDMTEPEFRVKENL